MQLVVTASDTCADNVNKRSGCRELSIVITMQLVKLQTSNWTCRTMWSAAYPRVHAGKPARTSQRQGLRGAWLRNRMFSCFLRLSSWSLRLNNWLLRLSSRSKSGFSLCAMNACSAATSFCFTSTISSSALHILCRTASS